MNQNQLVDMIVQEVKRVLAGRGIDVQNAAKETSPAARSSLAVSPAPLPVSNGADTIAIGTQDLTGKQVITQKDLESYKGQTINVTKKAVITPLARDYAKEKNITINRLNESEPMASGSSTTPERAAAALVIAPDFKGDGSIVKKILTSKRLDVKDFSSGSYEVQINKAADAVASNTVHFGICLENTGMEAAIVANRNRKIRAVHCRDTYEARAARVDIGANVIVLDSASNPEAVISGFTGL